MWRVGRCVEQMNVILGPLIDFNAGCVLTNCELVEGRVGRFQQDPRVHFDLAIVDLGLAPPAKQPKLGLPRRRAPPEQHGRLERDELLL